MPGSRKAASGQPAQLDDSHAGKCLCQAGPEQALARVGSGSWWTFASLSNPDPPLRMWTEETYPLIACRD